jgi:protein ImuB
VAALRPLPIAALRLDGETIAGLTRLDFDRIDQLVDAPRAPLTLRFGRRSSGASTRIWAASVSR